MNNAILNSILNAMAAKMAELGERPPNIKKINSILIECCQNLIHHSVGSADMEESWLPTVVIAKVAEHYEIITGNLIRQGEVSKLKDYIDKVNNMSKDDLRDYYQHVLTNGHISERGGGGLGILKIIRKTPDGKVNYDFTSVSPETSFFSFSFLV
jgi:hypothetical protein